MTTISVVTWLLWGDVSEWHFRVSQVSHTWSSLVCVCVCVCVYVYVCMCMCVSNCVFVAVETISGGCWPILSSQLLWRDYCVCRVTNGLRFPLRLQTSDHFFKVCVYLHACVHARVCCAPLEAHILMLYHKKGIIMCSLAPWLTDQNWVKQWG